MVLISCNRSWIRFHRLAGGEDGVAGGVGEAGVACGGAVQRGPPHDAQHHVQRQRHNTDEAAALLARAAQVASRAYPGKWWTELNLAAREALEQALGQVANERDFDGPFRG